MEVGDVVKTGEVRNLDDLARAQVWISKQPLGAQQRLARQ